MKKITVNKIIGYKTWIPIEVIEGSDEHKELIRWNKGMHIIQWQDKKEMDKLDEIAENEVSYEQKREETGFELIDENEPSPEEWYIQNEENRVIWDAIQELPKNQRIIIILYFYHGYKFREISRMLGKRLYSIQKSYQSALDKLKIILEEKIF